MVKDLTWDNYSFVIRGSSRKKVISAFDRPKTPSELGKEVKISVTHISRTLGELVQIGLVKCLTPKQRTGRIYNLTKEGEKIRKMMRE